MLSFLKRSHSFWDQVGITVSSLCFLHCAITPVLLLTLPWMGEHFHSHYFHVFIFVLVLPIGLYAFFQGYGHHRKTKVLWLGIPGLLLVTTAAFLPHEISEMIGEELLTVFGSVLLIAAHYFNRRSCRIHKH